MSENTLTVIALSCSPSRGRNSDSMLDAFLAGVKTHPEIRAEKIYLEDVPIDTYKFENRLGPLDHETKFKELTDKIKCAQGLVIAAPTYNFAVPAHLKNFIDRIRFFALNMDKRNALKQPVGMLGYLKTYFLVSGGTPNWAEKVLFFTFPSFWLRGVFLYYGAKVYGAIYSGDIKTFENKMVLEKCRQAGIKYGNKLIKNSANPLLEQIFWRPPQID